MITTLAVLAAVALSPQAQQPTPLPAPVRAAADRIAAPQLMKDIEYLASDALRGRDTFSPGFDSAAAYIIARVRRAGLKPLDGAGTFRQAYVVKEVRLDTSRTYVEIGGKRIPFGDDLLVQILAGEVSVTAPVVYVGTGVNVPSLGIDSYVGVDVKGKIVLVSGGIAPQGLSFDAIPPDAEFAPMAALARGAVALVSVASPRGVSRWATARGNPQARRELDPPVRSAYQAAPMSWLLLRPSAAAALFVGDSARGAQVLGVGLNPAAIPPSFQLPQTMTIRVTHGALRIRPSYNVVAVLEGSDPRLKSEYVSVASHLDGAVGTQPVNGDTIYNAADDNASGSAASLSIAEQMSRAPRPRRSVVFIWDSGEEVGLWGTRSFVGQQPVPLKDIVTHINIDMIGSTRAKGDTTQKDLADSNEVFITGPRMVSAFLDSTVNRANRASANMKLNFRFDTTTSEFFYPRTDAGPFMERRIPVIEFFTGLHDRYHGPADETKYLDVKKIESTARTAFATIWMVGNSPQRPTADKGWPSIVPNYLTPSLVP